ncbi:MAG: NUDIX hydrolase [Candidatus Pacebacteria bacterium]|nr:NUDIX hydrolase [Candidatus Paceibacterota bacterium]
MDDDIYNYGGPKLTVDIVTFLYNLKTLELKVLLIKRDTKPFLGINALPGGFIREDESSFETASRVLQEKTGITSMYIEQVKTFDSINRDPRGQIFSVAYMALVNEEELPDGLDARITQRLSISEIFSSKTKLAFDHKEIIQYAYNRLQAKISYSNLSALSLPQYFTLPDLQTVFEIVLGETVDKRNFRKKITTFGFLKETDKKRKGESKRPAQLYTNKYKKIVTYDRLI